MGETRKSVLITGGGGYVGIKLCQELVRRGFKVTALDVKFVQSSELARDEDELVEKIDGDITDAAGVMTAVAACKPCGVFHVASYGMSGREMLNKELIEAVNISGTEHVLNACRKHDVGWLVYTSTYNVVFGGQPIENGDTSLPYLPRHKYVDHYSLTKCIAEQAVIAANGNNCAGGGRLLTCALRCAGIYGEGEMRHLPRIVSNMRRGLCGFKFGDPNGLEEFIHIDNVVLAHCLAAKALDTAGQRDKVAGQAYFISDGKPINTFEFFRPLFERLGNGAPNITVPFRLVYFFAFLTELVHSLVYKVTGGYSFQPLMTRAEVLKTGVTHYFSMEKARVDLGYQPLERNLDEVVKYYQDRLPRQSKQKSHRLWFFLLNCLLVVVLVATLMSFIPMVT